jgi:hypothetical protein
MRSLFDLIFSQASKLFGTQKSDEKPDRREIFGQARCAQESQLPFFYYLPTKKNASFSSSLPFPPATNTILNMHAGCTPTEFGLRSLGLNFYHLCAWRRRARTRSGRSGAFSNFLRACT